MTITRHPALLLRGLSSDTKPTSNILTNTVFIETDTNRTFLYDGAGNWNFPTALTDDYTWIIYKAGSTYKAKSGYLGYSPVSDTNLNTVWSYIKANFNDGGEPTTDTTVGGSILFGKGSFTFATAPDAIDGTWEAGASARYHISGQGLGSTQINFTNGSTQEAGFEIKNLSHCSISNMRIDVSDFITNIIKINADASSAENNRIEHVHIRNTSAPPVSTQRGIYIYGNSSFSTFFNKVIDIYMVDIYTGIETAGPSANTTAWTFDKCTFWHAEYGIILKSGSLLTNISNIGHQCSATEGKYTVSVGSIGSTGAHYNNITNVWADAMEKAGYAPVILNSGSILNSVSNISIWNTADPLSRTKTIDNSANDTNTYQEKVVDAFAYRQKGTTPNRWYPAGNGVLSSALGVTVPTTTIVANVLYASPFIVATRTKFDSIASNVTTLQASSNIRMGIYTDTGNCYPNTLIFESPSLATTTTGVKSATITAALQWLAPGLYWTTTVQDGATVATMRGIGASLAPPILGIDSTLGTNFASGYEAAHTFGALPVTYPAGATYHTSGLVPAVFLRAV